MASNFDYFLYNYICEQFEKAVWNHNGIALLDKNIHVNMYLEYCMKVGNEMEKQQKNSLNYKNWLLTSVSILSLLSSYVPQDIHAQEVIQDTPQMTTTVTENLATQEVPSVEITSNQTLNTTSVTEEAVEQTPAASTTTSVTEETVEQTPAGSTTTSVTEETVDQTPAGSTMTTSEAQVMTETTSQPSNLSDNSESQAEFTLEDYKRASATELAQLVKDEVVSPERLIDMAAEVIEQTNPDLNGVISMRIEKAKEELAAMEDQGQPFYGVPILAKGLGHTVEGGQNTNGFTFLADETSRRSGRYIRTLQEAGFVVIGQTSFPQFGWINVTNSDLYGDTHNPWNLAHNPGGSSGGSAAAVTIGQVPIATTSDAGGSTRIPASFSSLIGLHPTSDILEGNSKGQTSHFSVTKTMEDTWNLFNVLLKDKYVDKMNNQVLDTSIPIAYSLKTPAGTPIDMEAVQAVKNAVTFLNEQGYKTVEVDYPVDGKAMMEDYYVNAAKTAGMVDFLARNKLKRPVEKDDVELLTWTLYQTSKDITKEDIAQVKENIQALKDKMNEFYKKYPIFLTATTAYPAPAADYNHIPEDLKDQMEDMSNLSKDEKLDLIYEQWLPAWTKTPYTQLANLTEMPSLSLPTHLTPEGLPIGILFNSARYNDRLLMQMGDLFEKANKFKMFYRTVDKLDATILPFQTEYIVDHNLTPSQSYTTQVGRNGMKFNRYRISYAGNNIIKQELLEETILEAIPEIIHVGLAGPLKHDDSQEVVADEPITSDNVSQNDDMLPPASKAQTMTEENTLPHKPSYIAQNNDHPRLPQTGDNSMIIILMAGTSIVLGVLVMIEERRVQKY